MKPPATKTFPLGKSVAVWSSLAAIKFPVDVNVPVVGLYSSELAIARGPDAKPPAIKTFPVLSSVEVSDVLALLMLPVATN